MIKKKSFLVTYDFLHYNYWVFVLCLLFKYCHAFKFYLQSIWVLVYAYQYYDACSRAISRQITIAAFGRMLSLNPKPAGANIFC